MRPTSALLLVLTLLSLWLRPATVAAQDEDQNPGASAETGAEVIAQEPDLFDRGALADDAELLDELLTRSTEQTITEQKFAAAAGTVSYTHLTLPTTPYV